MILYAAGSLRPPMSAVAEAFTQRTGVKVDPTFGASGLLRDEIARGARADVFASANLEHPQALVAAGWSDEARPFARNHPCALTSPRITATSDTLLNMMLDATVTLGTSTPGADPSGDYAWEVFRKAEGLQPGAFATLSQKARPLTGGPQSAPPPAGRNLYGILVAKGDADIFLTYCTNAKLARDAEPALRIVSLPPSLSVGAVYGMAVRRDASPASRECAAYVLSAEGQRELARFGFDPP